MLRSIGPKVLTLVIGLAIVVTLVTLVLTRVSSGPDSGSQNAQAPAPASQSLKDLGAQRDLSVGTAINPALWNNDENYRSVLQRQFSMVTPENEMKWNVVHPSRDHYDFQAADDIVDNARKNNQQVRGHTLVWFKSNPEWLDAGHFSADELRSILHDHINKVVGHYKGKVVQWDVVNEPLDDDGKLHPGIWLDTLGPSYIADAFRWAHEADPAAKLYLNETGAETSRAKTKALMDLVDSLKSQGVPIDGVGFESHLTGSADTAPLKPAMKAVADRGLDVAVTELDVRMELHDGAYDAKAQAKVYGDVVRACVQQPRCKTLAVWGFTDASSWVPARYPGLGAATLFDANYNTKPAFGAVVSALSQ